MSLDPEAAFALRARLAREGEGREVGFRDPAIERHRAALFGTPADPDPTPVGARSVAPGRCLLEWVGQPSPYDSEVVRALKARGLLRREERAVLERVALLRVARVDGLTSRTLTAERDGLSETVRWGPATGTYVREVAIRDADRILSESAIAEEFRLVGREAGRGPAVKPDAAWLALINALRARRGLAPVAADHAALRFRYGREEGLVGLGPVNAIGYWT